MSNPGVITLAALRNVGPNVKRLDIEDNIGEAIHIHWNGLRIELGVSAFLRLADELVRCETSLTAVDGYAREDFDPYFLFRMGPLVARIARIEIQKRRLRDLRCLVSVSIPKLGTFELPRSVERTPAYRYLNGSSNTFLEYEQDAYPGLSNDARISGVAESIRSCGYPNDKQYIVLFGDQNYIRDGQHRAAALAACGGMDQVIEVMVIHFHGRDWRLHPYGGFLRGSLSSLVLKGARRARAALSSLGKS